MRHEEESGLLRLLPVAAALITMGPLLGAIHWAVTIDPVYDSNLRRSSILEAEDSGLKITKPYTGFKHFFARLGLKGNFQMCFGALLNAG